MPSPATRRFISTALRRPVLERGGVEPGRRRRAGRGRPCGRPRWRPGPPCGRCRRAGRAGPAARRRGRRAPSGPVRPRRRPAPRRRTRCPRRGDDRRRARARAAARGASSATSSADVRRRAAGSAAIRSTPRSRRPLGDLAAQRVAAVQVVGAVGRHDRDRARRSGRENRKLSRSRVDWSAQWQSSMTSSSGRLGRGLLEQRVHGGRTGRSGRAPSSVAAAAAARTAPGDRAGSRVRVGCALGDPLDDARAARARAGRAPRRTAGRAARCRRSRGSGRPRRASPRLTARSRSSTSSRVLPTPASPDSSTCRRPARAQPDDRTPSNEAISVSSASRPTRVRLVVCATSSMIPCSVVGGVGISVDMRRPPASADGRPATSPASRPCGSASGGAGVPRSRSRTRSLPVLDLRSRSGRRFRLFSYICVLLRWPRSVC